MIRPDTPEWPKWVQSFPYDYTNKRYEWNTRIGDRHYRIEVDPHVFNDPVTHTLYLEWTEDIPPVDHEYWRKITEQFCPTLDDVVKTVSEFKTRLIAYEAESLL